MSLFIPKEGRKEILRGMLCNMEIILGLFANHVSPDGSMQVSDLTELTSGGGRGYAAKTLAGEVVEAALTASKWKIAYNTDGNAEGIYNNEALTWTLTSYDVADKATICGAFGYFWVIPFDGGVTEITPGNTVTGATSGASGVVTLVNKYSGTWGSDAAGVLWIKTKTGTFQDGENLQVSAATRAVSNTGTENGGDAIKKLLFVDVFTESHDGDKVGLTVEYTPTINVASD